VLGSVKQTNSSSSPSWCPQQRARLNPSFCTGMYQPQSSAMICSVLIPFSDSFYTKYSVRRLPHRPGLICSCSPSQGGNLLERNSTCVFIG
jgi:hypothetical protein